MSAIVLKDVSFSYEEGGPQVLSHGELTVEYGEVALLCGLSGEGKSTVLSLIAGIIPHVTPGQIQGEVYIDGVSTAGQSMGQICRKVGVVLQNAESQIIQQLVEDEIAFGCENFALSPQEIAQRIQESCQVMKLSPQWRTRTLSGGQKQRLMTAATLATGQRILVLDEPLANLDRAGAHLLMGALRRLASSGYAVLVVEHRLDMVLPYVDRVWNIRQGQITRVENKEAYLTAQARYIADTCPASQSREPLLELQQVGFAVKDREILREIDLTLHRGERLLLLGENGCGKTTLLRLMARLYRPTRGRILQRIDPALGQGPKGDRSWFQRVGVVYQNPNYQLFMPTVEQEIAFGAARPEDAREMMARFGLEHLAQRHPHSLSEGQKRRVSIAAVVASRPDLLLLDEPTVGQDYQGLKEMVEILNDLHRQTGNTVVTITHDMRCAEALCDHAALVEQGVIAQEGGKELAHRYFYQQGPVVTPAP